MCYPKYLIHRFLLGLKLIRKTWKYFFFWNYLLCPSFNQEYYCWFFPQSWLHCLSTRRLAAGLPTCPPQQISLAGHWSCGRGSTVSVPHPLLTPLRSPTSRGNSSHEEHLNGGAFSTGICKGMAPQSGLHVLHFLEQLKTLKRTFLVKILSWNQRKKKNQSLFKNSLKKILILFSRNKIEVCARDSIHCEILKLLAEIS